MCRFIPACAGNSSKSMPGAPSNTVHPRLRGELKSIEGIDICWCGSSPLTRGTQSKALPRTVPRRFIPAYAGNSFSLSHHPIHYSVHPRLRGELYLARLQQISYCGSSPLTRGTLNYGNRRYRRRRFIPAYAGNSTFCVASGNRRTVHPRLRGELFIGVEVAFFPTRFIPAYAGNSVLYRITIL